MLNNEYYIWGAGTYGERLIEFMKDDLTFKAVIDNDPAKQGTTFHGLPVISYDEAKKDLPRVKIVIAINIPSKAQALLLSEGFVKDKDFFVIHSFIPRYFWSKDRTLVIKAADIAATTICTMKCEGCFTLIPIVKKRSNLNTESILGDIDLLFAHIDRVMNVNFCVGESLLNEDIPYIVNQVYEKYRDRYSCLSVQTNGTVMPADNALQSISKAKALVVIANYPESTAATKKLIEKCDEFDVSWFYNSGGGSREKWLDMGDPHILREDDPQKLRELFARCWQPGMALYNGHLYICASQAWSHLVAEVGTLEPGDAFDLRQPKTESSQEELYKVISRQPPERGYLSHCARCNGAMKPLVVKKSDNSVRISAGMSDSARYELLKDKIIIAPLLDNARLTRINTDDYDALERIGKSGAFKILRKIGEDFGVFKEGYTTQDLDVEFRFSKRNLQESIHAHNQQGIFVNYAEMLTTLDAVIGNAVGIEAHNERYNNPRSQLDAFYVFISAFCNDEYIIPVLLKVKTYSDETTPVLYVALSLREIKRSRILGHTPDTKGIKSYPSPTSFDTTLSDLLSNVNTEDKNLLKYIPDGFLDNMQKEAKQIALKKTADYIDRKNKQRYSTTTDSTDESGFVNEREISYTKDEYSLVFVFRKKKEGTDDTI